ncbi:low psii accumulation2 [Wolffia australiana]
MEIASACSLSSKRLSNLFFIYRNRSTKRLISVSVRAVQEEGENAATSSSNRGFGGDLSPAKKKGKENKGKIVRREPIQKPSSVYPRGGGSSADSEQIKVDESAFLLTWLGLGILILVEGIALAASGFLPESVDSFFSKFVYPAFTPTVGLFVAGTVAYGVFKYLQGESQSPQ